MKKLALLVGLSLLLVACDESIEGMNEVVVDEPSKIEVVAEIAEPVEELTVDQKIEKAIVKAVGKKNNLDKKRVDSITYVEEDKAAFVALNASENFSNNLTKKGIWLDSVEVFEATKDIEEVDLFLFYWYLPLFDAYGNEKSGLVMSFEITKEELQKINYDNFPKDNVPNIVVNYFEHTAFNE